MQFARRFWLAAVCTLGLLVSTSVVQAQQTKLLPNDTEMVVTFNLQQILKSEIVKSNQVFVDIVKGKITEQLDNKGVAKYLKAANFDVFRDLSSVTVAVPAGRDTDEPFIILEGSFDAAKIEAAAMDANKEAGGAIKMTKIGGVKAFEISKDDKTLYVGILSKKTMIACGSKADFAEAVGRFNGTKNPNFKSATVKNLLETVNAKQSISFMATSEMIGKLVEKSPQGNNDQAKVAVAALKQMEGLSAAITVEKNIDFLVGVNTKDKETAAKYAAMGSLLIQGARAKLAEQEKTNEKLKPAVEILKTVEASAKGSNLVIRGQITFENLGEILKLIPMNQ